MPGRRYTKEEKAERMKMIRRMHEDGKTTEEIGKAVGISGSTAWLWLKEDGADFQNRKGGVRREYDLNKLKKLADEGRTIADIAEQMDASAFAINTWMKKHNIEINMEARRARQQAEKEKVFPKKEKKPEPIKMCKTCIYRSGVSGYGCNYNLIVKKSRRCGVIGCVRYVKGKRIRLSEDFAEA